MLGQVNISVNPFESFDGQSLEIIRFVTPTMSPGFITLRRDGAEFMDTIRLTNETHVMFALDPLMLSDNGTAFQCIFEAYSSEEVVITVQRELPIGDFIISLKVASMKLDQATEL